MRRNPIRQRWAEGRPASNLWVDIGWPVTVEALGRLAYDSYTIDMQHSLIDRATLVPLLQAIPGVSVAPARGGMYAFFRLPGSADSLDTAKRLVREAGVGLAPGAAFGATDGAGGEAGSWLRWCFASRDPQRLVQGVDRLRGWMRQQPGGGAS